MGKYSAFPRIDKDRYITPRKGVLPLIPWLPEKSFRFIEPCAADGQLIGHLEDLTNATCVEAFDIEATTNPRVRQANSLLAKPTVDFDLIITNPPWTRTILHPMIDRFAEMAPTWLLFDTNWMFTKQAAPYLDYCSHIVCVGRLKWFPDSPHTGKEDAAWYLFDKKKRVSTEYFGR